MIIIQGEMGSGKSRLALDLLKHKEKGLYLLLDKDHSVLHRLKKQKMDYTFMTNCYLMDIKYRILLFLKLELCIIGNKLKIMKRSSLTVLFFVAFSLSYCQKWEMKDFGNAFDGIVKMCAVEALETTPEGIMLGVVNDFAEIKLSRWYGEDGFMNNLHIRLLVDESYFNKSERVEKILMSFDRDKDVYEIGRLYQVAIGQPIAIDYAFLGKYSKCFNKVDICNLFKLKRQVNFRMYTENGYHDISFPLAGSTVAIEKTYKIPKYIRKGDWTDFAIEGILFTGLMSKANDGEDNISFAASNCLKYLV